jgi:hypothetical protein
VANIWQVVWEWTGFSGAPGFTNLFFASSAGTATEALSAATNSRLFFDGVKGILSDDCHIAVQTDVRLIDDVTGDLQNIFSITGVSPVVGTATANYAGAVGLGVDWLTTTVHGSRRMQGRTFIVPAVNAYDDVGSPNSTSILAVATAAEAMRTASGPVFGVWGRPRAANPSATPPVTARDGLFGPATASRVPDRVFVLRSRRD